MIEDYSRDLLRSGLIELKAGNRDGARRYIDRALYMSGDHDVMAEAWYWMSQLTDDPAEKRRALENCLSHDLRHARARRALAILDGKLKAEDIIDPDAAQTRATERPSAAERSQSAEAQRFMCPKCGGRMHFAPDGQSLVCDYCTRGVSLSGASGGHLPQSAQDKDFLLAMATARGHDRPLNEQVFLCQGCGAQFILPPEMLSITCPYCASPHVVSFEKSADLLAPDGIIPHAFDQARATRALHDWLVKMQNTPARQAEQKRRQQAAQMPTAPQFESPRGFYLPVWSFDLGGAIDYTGEKVEEEHAIIGGRAPRIVRVSDSYPVMLSRLPIPGSRKLSAPFIHLLPTYDLRLTQPYDPRYLSDWPAELYDIPMAEASLDARSQGYALLKRDMAGKLVPLRLISASSANLVIDAFRLILVPVWMTELPTSTGAHIILVNGQTGAVYGDLGRQPTHSGAIMSWLSDLIND